MQTEDHSGLLLLSPFSIISGKVSGPAIPLWGSETSHRHIYTPGSLLRGPPPRTVWLRETTPCKVSELATALQNSQVS